MASTARQHPNRRFVTMSPGNTSGTGTLNDRPVPLRLAAKYVMPALGANTITGPVVDQADIFPDLRNPSFQHNANQAIHRFIPA